MKTSNGVKKTFAILPPHQSPMFMISNNVFWAIKPFIFKLTSKVFWCGGLSILVFLSVAGFVFAIGLKVKPNELNMQGTMGSVVRREIVVENPDNNVALFEVYPDNFSDWILVKPASFTLESGKSQKVILEVKAKETGVFFTDISVVAKPLADSRLAVNSGVKIPCHITISERAGAFTAFLAGFWNKKIAPIIILGLILLVVFFLFFVFWRRKNQKMTL